MRPLLVARSGLEATNSCSRVKPSDVTTEGLLGSTRIVLDFCASTVWYCAKPEAQAASTRPCLPAWGSCSVGASMLIPVQRAAVAITCTDRPSTPFQSTGRNCVSVKKEETRKLEGRGRQTTTVLCCGDAGAGLSACTQG